MHPVHWRFVNDSALYESSCWLADSRGVCAAGIPYEITVWTGDVHGAGTDSNVFIQMYGEDGKTEEYMLRNRTNNFEQAQVDKFKVTEF